MEILSLPDRVFARIIGCLELNDLIAFGDSHSKIRDFIYESPELWTSDLLFPEGSQHITDDFVRKFVPRITRHYGILTLKMVDLFSLSSFGYLLIFDQFAHSVKNIEIRTTPAILSQLVYHLTIFAGNLALLQQNNNIPITFRQYSFDDEHEFESNLLDSTLYKNQASCSFPHLITYLYSSVQLDDPPFERLEGFYVSSTSDDHDIDTTIQQLQTLAFFLAGKSLVNTPNSGKRSRDEYIQSNIKYRKHDTEPHHLNQYNPQFHHEHNKLSY